MASCAVIGLIACGGDPETKVAELPPGGAGGDQWSGSQGGSFGTGGSPGGSPVSQPGEQPPGNTDGSPSQPGAGSPDDGTPTLPGNDLPPVEAPPEEQPPAEEPPTEDPPPQDPPPQDPPPVDDPPPMDDPPDEPIKEPAPGGDGECYYELYYPNVPIGDLKSGYQDSQWKQTILTVLERRYPHGHWMVNEMKDDPYMSGFIWGSGFGNLMDSMGTVCHEETHGWDYDTALGMYPNHAYYMTQELKFYPPKGDTPPRSVILNYLPSGLTNTYDSTYLYGSMGTYEFYDLGDEINAYINGLGCNTAVGEQIPFGVSARDGAAMHLLYLLMYLKAVRLEHPSTYQWLKGQVEWQYAVRYWWARGLYWIGEAQQFPNLGIYDVPIMTELDDPANHVEIQHFTGQTAEYVECYPQNGP